MLKKSSIITGLFAATLLSAGAQAQMAQQTTTRTVEGGTTTTRTVDTPDATTTVKQTDRLTHDGTGVLHKTEVKSSDVMGTHRTVHRCVTHWRHGHRVRTCRTTVRHHI